MEDKQFIKNQLGELLTNYGEIPFVIIDGWNANWGGPLYDKLPFEEIDEFVKKLQPNCLLMNISCEENLNHTDIVFYENAAGQDVDNEFQGPGASCNILTDTWFWRIHDSDKELKSARWAIEKIDSMNKHNVTFLLNGAPNQRGKLDKNVIERFAEIGKMYKRPEDISDLPEKWMLRNLRSE